MKNRILGAAVLLGALLVPAAPAHAAAGTEAWAPGCTLARTELPLPSGITDALIAGTDDHAGFAGYAPAGWSAYSWKNGTVTDHGVPAGADLVTVADQNSSGTFVGQGLKRTTGLPYTRAISSYIVRGGAMTQLPWLANHDRTYVSAISANGDAFGVASRSGGHTSVRWPAANPTQVTPVPGVPADWRTLLDASDDGRTLLFHEGIWRDGKATPLPTLDGLDWSPHSMSNGRVVGAGLYGANDKQVAVLMDQNGSVRILPNTAADTNNSEYLINSSGLIVGSTVGQGGGKEQYGMQVWKLGTYIGTFGTPLDVAQALGDDGTVGGYHDGYNYGTPSAWTCS
ncbi:hypothetical protein ACFQVC_05390 [Streptomyces monticola]|uniref:Uncharacterized protein n=1 Tax=Streptomyces monticola TaxID=2666263 RepID=A0ABW2JE05_9ACTN